MINSSCPKTVTDGEMSTVADKHLQNGPEKAIKL